MVHPLPLPQSINWSTLFLFAAFQCGTCNECFEKPGELETHIHIVHGIRKRQSIEAIKKCIVCCKFLNQYETNRHLCTDLNQIECEHCHKEYKTTSGLLRHLNAVHTTEMLYECARCQQEFRMKLLMTIHNEVSSMTISSIWHLFHNFSINFHLFFSLMKRKT